MNAGRFAEAAIDAREASELLSRFGERRRLAFAQQLLARSLIGDGRLDEAERLLDSLGDPLPATLLASRAQLRLRQGRPAEGAADARSALPELRSLGMTVRCFAQVTLYDASLAAGDLTGAREALALARAEVDRVVALEPDAEARRMLVTHVPEYARVMSLTHG